MLSEIFFVFAISSRSRGRRQNRQETLGELGEQLVEETWTSVEKPSQHPIRVEHVRGGLGRKNRYGVVGIRSVQGKVTSPAVAGALCCAHVACPTCNESRISAYALSLCDGATQSTVAHGMTRRLDWERTRSCSQNCSPGQCNETTKSAPTNARGASLGHLERVSRRLLEEHFDVVRRFIGRSSGICVLYRKIDGQGPEECGRAVKVVGMWPFRRTAHCHWSKRSVRRGGSKVFGGSWQAEGRTR